MRRAQGRTLARLLADADSRDKRLALLPVVTRVAQTIGFAHDRGVVHRDIKPDNILVGDHGETFVLDWGLARVRGVPVDDSGGASSGGDGTQYGSVVGTPAYMAPEQAAGDLDRIDERSDVFALGALLYHVITGAAPYRADSVDALIEKAKAARIAPIVEAGLPRELVAICERATAREPGDRYRNAHELARALEELGAHALIGRPSRAINIAFDVVMLLIMLGMVLGIYELAKFTSSLREQGLAAPFVVAFSVIGAIASAIEWRTRGRYRLGAVAFALAFITFFGAVSGFVSGLSVSLSRSLPNVGDDALFREGVARGLYESLGSVAVAAQLAAFQLALWAFARRRVQRAEPRAAGA
jgi:hypothetical protein